MPSNSRKNIVTPNNTPAQNQLTEAQLQELMQNCFNTIMDKLNGAHEPPQELLHILNSLIEARAARTLYYLSIQNVQNIIAVRNAVQNKLAQRQPNQMISFALITPQVPGQNAHIDIRLVDMPVQENNNANAPANDANDAAEDMDDVLDGVARLFKM